MEESKYVRYPIIALRFKECLKNRNMTAQELSDVTGIGKSSISHYVNGTHCPSSTSAIVLANALKVEPAYLMGFNSSDTHPRNEEHPCARAQVESYLKMEKFVVEENNKEHPALSKYDLIIEMLKTTIGFVDEAKKCYPDFSNEEWQLVHKYRDLQSDEIKKAVKTLLGITD